MTVFPVSCELGNETIDEDRLDAIDVGVVVVSVRKLVKTRSIHSPNVGNLNSN